MAQMDISQFKNKLGAGGSRPNQFLVTLNWPTIIGAAVTGDDALLVTSAALPASNVNPTIVQYRGREVKLAGERTFDPCPRKRRHGDRRGRGAIALRGPYPARHSRPLW